MKSVSILLFVTTVTPKVVSLESFGYLNRIPFIVRGGSDGGIEHEVVTDSKLTNVVDIESVEALNLNGCDTKDVEDGTCQEGQRVDDAVTVRGGAHSPDEATDPVDDDALATEVDEDVTSEVSESKHDEDNEDENGEADVVEDDPSTSVRGGADVPESTELIDDNDDLPDVDHQGADGEGNEDEDEGDEAASVEDPTDVRGGADVPPELTDQAGGAEMSVVDVEVMDDDALVNNENDDLSGEGGDDSTAVRGGADVPESTDQHVDDELPVDDDMVEVEVSEIIDEENDGEDGATPIDEDPTSVRGGADVPEPVDPVDDNEPSSAEDKSEKDTDEIDEDDDDGEGGADVDVKSVRGGAKHAANSKEVAYDAEYEDEDEEVEEGQFDADEDFYEDDDEFSLEANDDAADAARTEEDLHAEDQTMDTADELSSVYETEAHQHATDDDSSAFVDREELADAYDDEPVLGATTSFRAGHTDDDDRASIDDVPLTDATTGTHEYEPTVAEHAVDVPAEKQAVADEEGKSVDLSTEVISKEVERILVKECGFRTSELRGMKPQIANVMAEKRLRRPQEGIPDSWYDEKRKGLVLATVAKVLAAVIPIAVGAALAFFAGEDLLKLIQRRGKSELLIGVEDAKPRTDGSELTIPGNETDAESLEEETSDIPTPASSNKVGRFQRSGLGGGGNWLQKRMRSNST